MDKILTLGIETSCDETAGNVTLHPVSTIQRCNKFSLSPRLNFEETL